jgi:hypothetical protein
MEIWTQVFTRHVARLEIVTCWGSVMCRQTNDSVVRESREVAW